MSDTPINLNKARKAAKRTSAKVQAEGNVAKFGRTKEARAAEELHAARLRRDLDGKKRET